MISLADGVEINGDEKGPRKGLCCFMWCRIIQQQPEV